MLKKSITSLILAGGNSTRMGKDKALLKINGETFLSKICNIALECSDLVYVITHRKEIYQNILPQGCQIIHEKSLFGESLPHGALLGFIQGLRKIESEWVLLLACDLPFLSSDEVKKWLESLDNISPRTLALLPKNNNRWEALSGFYHSSCLPLLEKYIRQGDRSFQKWLNINLVQELPLSNSEILLNCNTPEDYKKITKQIYYNNPALINDKNI